MVLVRVPPAALRQPARLAARGHSRFSIADPPVRPPAPWRGFDDLRPGMARDFFSLPGAEDAHCTAGVLIGNGRQRGRACSLLWHSSLAQPDEISCFVQGA